MDNIYNKITWEDAPGNPYTDAMGRTAKNPKIPYRRKL